MNTAPLVVKLGGAALRYSLEKSDLLEKLATYRGPMVVVHGGGPAISLVANALGVKSEFIDGQRITSPEMMAVVEMVLSGEVNSRIVRSLLKNGKNAIGLSGVDAKLLQCVPENANLGQVGKVRSVNTSLLYKLLDQGLCPIVSPVGLFLDYSSCNVNADLAATRIASDMKASKFLFITDTNGIYDNQKNTIAQMSVPELKKMCQSDAVNGGMRVKARAILEYLELFPEGTAQVIDGVNPTSLERFLKDGTGGTTVKT